MGQVGNMRNRLEFRMEEKGKKNRQDVVMEKASGKSGPAAKG